MKLPNKYRTPLLVGACILLLWGISFWLRDQLSFIQKESIAPGEQITVTDAAEPYDFSNLFLLTTKQEQSLISGVIEAQSVEKDLIEYYQTDFATYTKYTLRVTHNFTDRFSRETITVYRLGDADAFPNRENLQNGNEYLMRLQPFVHGDEIIYLVSPLESTFLQVKDSAILSHKTATGREFTKLASIEQFKQAFDKYKAAQNYLPSIAGFVEEFRSVCKTLQEFDYNNKALEYRPDAAFQKLTKSTAQAILSKLETIQNDFTLGVMTEQEALKAAKDCLS